MIKNTIIQVVKKIQSFQFQVNEGVYDKARIKFSFSYENGVVSTFEFKNIEELKRNPIYLNEDYICVKCNIKEDGENSFSVHKETHILPIDGVVTFDVEKDFVKSRKNTDNNEKTES